jgi:acetyl-CoA acetyltransferase
MDRAGRRALARVPVMLKDQVAVAGLGRSPYARDRGEVTELAMVLEAAVEAVRDAGLTAADIDAVVGGGLYTGGVDPTVVASALGLTSVGFWTPARPPIVNHLSAAVHALVSGSCKAVLVYHSVYRLGRDPFRPKAAMPDGHGESEPWGMYGSIGYAAWAARYLAEFGRSRQDLALVAINGRSNAADNPEAVMREPLTLADYLGGRMIREPLCLYDMDLAVDGADAFVLTTTERARDLPRPPVLVHALAMGMADHPEEHLMSDFGHTGQAVVAKALRVRSDLWIDDVDVFLPYDGFSVIALRCFESYGFCGDGEAGDFLTSEWNDVRNRVLIKGRVPVNPHGGSLSEGGTQGAGHLREAVRQLRGDAGARQVADARAALLTPGGFFFNAQGLVLRAD